MPFSSTKSSYLPGGSLIRYIPDVGGGVQVALLREKLAKEQQRARAAEATLAAQHQMQQLLQSAVHAVLLARSATQQVAMHACVTCVCDPVCMYALS